MRVVLLTSKLNFKTAGGSVMDLHLKAKGLVDLGHDVTVVTAFSYANIIPEPLPYKHIEEMVLARGLIGIQRGALRILQKYQSRADIFYIDGQIFLYGGGMYRLVGGKVPVVAFFNTRINAWADTQGNVAAISSFKKIKRTARKWIENTLGVYITKHLDSYIFNTPMLAKLYFAAGYSEAKSTVIEDFVDMQSIIEQNHITEEKITQRQHNAPLITFFSTGRMLPEKGFDLIVKAFASLEHKDKCRVIISGTGPDKERVEALAKELGVSDYFTFPGWVTKEALARYFLTSHVFIFPKWWMEYGSALLTEALAFGKPCIIPGGGALEWLTQGKSPTFTPDDPKNLARVMEELASNENLRIQAGTDALVRAKTLDCRILSKRLEHVLETQGHFTQKT